jgi:hypothetical protein
LVQDLETLKQEQVSQKRRDCLVLRIKEKEKLEKTVKFCKDKLAELNKS